jgi:hypothetical protein
VNFKGKGSPPAKTQAMYEGMYPTARTKLAVNSVHAAACMQEYAAVRSDRQQKRISRTHAWHPYREQLNDDLLGVHPH